MSEAKTIKEAGDNPFILMDSLLDKLKILNYENLFCKQKSDASLRRPLSHIYFALPSGKSNEQFYYFTSLVSFLLGLGGQVFPPPDQFDDPNVTSVNIVEELKKAGLNPNFTPVKLKDGSGEIICSTLNILIDWVFEKKGFRFQKPIYPKESKDQITEDNGDNEEITADESIVDDGMHDDELLDNAGDETPRSKDVSVIESKVNPEEWRLEVERVTPLLNAQKLGGDKSDWRNHFEKIKAYHKTIFTHVGETRSQLDKMCLEITVTLDQIETREKFINSSFDHLVEEYKTAQISLNEISEKFNGNSGKVNTLTNELQGLLDELDKIKQDTSNHGSSLSDTGPLIKLKSAMNKIKEEVNEFEVRIGIVENTLLAAKIRAKKHSPFRTIVE